MTKLRVLYIIPENHGIGGSTLSLLNMLHSVRDSVEERIVVREEGIVSHFLRDSGFTVVTIPFLLSVFNGSVLKRTVRFLPHLFNVLWRRRRFVALIRSTLSDWPPDLIHSNSGVVDVGLYLARALGVPHVWHIREYMDLDFALHPFPNWNTWRRSLSNSDSVIAVSSGIYNHHHLNLLPIACWINDAVRPASFRKVHLLKQKYFVFCAGSFSSAKMPEVAVGAFRDSGVWHDGFRLRLVGNCPVELQQDLLSLAGDAASSLDFIGYSSDVCDHLLYASGFLMTSRCEGLGRVTIEAMFCGCPVIARRSGGSLDILKDKETGFFFDTQNQCAMLISYLAGEIPTDVIEKAADRAVEEFSEEVYGKKVLAVYYGLCGDYID